MKKIAIFENEYDTIKLVFESSNIIKFGGTLDIKIYESSQKANLEEVKDMDVIFIDIDLSKKSNKDGYGVIKDLISIDTALSKRIVILTGNNNIQKSLRDHFMDSYALKIIYKPTDFIEVSNVISSITG